VSLAEFLFRTPFILSLHRSLTVQGRKLTGLNY
jgi:hypothetical protein